jgi:hypothetical protein
MSEQETLREELENNINDAIYYAPKDGSASDLVRDPFNDKKYCVFCGKPVEYSHPKGSPEGTWVQICNCELASRRVAEIQSVSAQINKLIEVLNQSNKMVKPAAVKQYYKLYRSHDNDRANAESEMMAILEELCQ